MALEVSTLQQYGLPPRCLRLAVTENPGQIRLQGGPGNIQVAGPMVHIMSIMAAALNTCLEYVTPTSAESRFGVRLPNGTWTGVMGLLHRQEADIVGLLLLVDEDRWADFDVGMALFPRDDVLTYTRPIPTADLTGFVKPYTPQVWWVVLVTMVVVWMVLWAVHQLQSTVLPNTRNGTGERGAGDIDDGSRDMVWTSAAWTLVPPLAQACWRWPQTGQVRTVAGVWILMSVVLSSVYRSNLKAMLILPRPRLPFQSMEELIQSRIPCFVADGTVKYQDIMDASPGSQLFRLRPQLVIHSDVLAAIRDLMHGRHAVTSPRSTALSIIHENFLRTRTCPLYLVPIDGDDGWFHIFFRKQSPLRHKVDDLMLRLVESGLLSKLLMDDVLHASECLKPDSPARPYNKLRPLELGDCYGIFSVYSGGILLAWLVLLMEWVAYLLHRRDLRRNREK